MYNFALAPSPTVTYLRDPESIHRDLAHWNRRRLAAGDPVDDWQSDLREDARMRWLEGVWIESFRQTVCDRAAAAPRSVRGFVDWFVALKQTGPGQNDPLFDWLAEDAALDDLKWFLTQEAAGE